MSTGVRCATPLIRSAAATTSARLRTEVLVMGEAPLKGVHVKDIQISEDMIRLGQFLKLA